MRRVLRGGCHFVVGAVTSSLVGLGVLATVFGVLTMLHPWPRLRVGVSGIVAVFEVAALWFLIVRSRVLDTLDDLLQRIDPRGFDSMEELTHYGLWSGILLVLYVAMVVGQRVASV